MFGFARIISVALPVILALPGEAACQTDYSQYVVRAGRGQEARLVSPFELQHSDKPPRTRL